MILDVMILSHAKAIKIKIIIWYFRNQRSAYPPVYGERLFWDQKIKKLGLSKAVHFLKLTSSFF